MREGGRKRGTVIVWVFRDAPLRWDKTCKKIVTENKMRWKRVGNLADLHAGLTCEGEEKEESKHLRL